MNDNHCDPAEESKKKILALRDRLDDLEKAFRAVMLDEPAMDALVAASCDYSKLMEPKSAFASIKRNFLRLHWFSVLARWASMNYCDAPYTEEMAELLNVKDTQERLIKEAGGDIAKAFEKLTGEDPGE